MNEWENEPNELAWVDEETQLQCYVLRHPRNLYLCGYVKLPERWELFSRMFRELAVHGGVTYTGSLKSRGDGYWAGFDCGHIDDIMPAYEHLFRCGDATYKNIEYVKNECKKLAQQIHSFMPGKIIRDIVKNNSFEDMSDSEKDCIAMVFCHLFSLYPWLEQVIDNNFDPNFAQEVLLKAAAEIQENKKC